MRKSKSPKEYLLKSKMPDMIPLPTTTTTSSICLMLLPANDYLFIMVQHYLHNNFYFI